MASIINTNINSLNAQMNLSKSQDALSTSIERLSSGLRINSAKDDAAGLAIATRMTAQINGMNQAIRNSNDALSFSQVADSGLQNQTDALQRMRELAVESANGTNGSGDRANLDAEFQQLASQVSSIASSTKFNGNSVFGVANTFQVGADTTDTIAVAAVSAGTISGDVTTASTASAAISAIDTALNTINTTRATLGAVENRFSSVISNLQASSTDQSTAKSRIMDADFAAETANMTRNQILQQAGTAMVAQANSLPNGVLSLLKG